MPKHEPDVEAMFTQEFWDERYSATDALWSGHPNPRLVENVSELTPGTALDLGCGEGADALWLAERGWQVTAVDVSPVALERGTKRAKALRPDVALRVTWRREDLREWEPPPFSFDLVSEQFLHLPKAIRRVQHARFATAVRPGGVLLIVGHHPADFDTTMPRPHQPELFFTAEEEARTLSPDQWRVSASSPTREVVDPDGRPVTITDAVLRAERLA